MADQPVVPFEEISQTHVTAVAAPSGSDNVAVTVFPTSGLDGDRVTDPSSSSMTAAAVIPSALFPVPAASA